MKYALIFPHTVYVQGRFRPTKLSRDARRSPRELYVISARFELKLQRVHKISVKFASTKFHEKLFNRSLVL
jgi:hypothetical protein